ncbi:MAG: DUF2505 domain-containing protein [Gammaproteobacteria bacterium]|nr:MAG: DUF2505 domain-containing protein [Gammaproteobacteria bacterium]
MQIKGEYTYPYSVDAVLETLAEPRHIQAKHRFLGARGVRIHTCKRDTDRFDLDLSREVPAEVPQIFRTLIAEWNEVRQTEHWQRCADGSWHATIQFQVHGMPIELKGEQRLTREGDETVHKVRMDLTCKVPVIGHKLAEFISVRIRDTLRGEFAFTENALREQISSQPG